MKFTTAAIAALCVFSLCDASSIHASHSKRAKPATIPLSLKVMADGLPVKDFYAEFTLGDIRTRRTQKISGRTDKYGELPFSIPPGVYRFTGISTGSHSIMLKHSSRSISGQNITSLLQDDYIWRLNTIVIGPAGERPFDENDYFKRSTFWNADEIYFIASPGREFPAMEFIRRFDLLHPQDDATVKEVPPLFQWERVEGAKGYTFVLYEKRRRKSSTELTFGTEAHIRKKEDKELSSSWEVHTRRNILTTHYRPEGIGLAIQSLLLGPLFKEGRSYYWQVKAIGPGGAVINESKKFDFTIP